MNYPLFDFADVRIEISFKSLDELALLLKFYHENNIYKLNIPCKNILKKQMLLNAIEFSREQYPCIDIIPHFSIQHQYTKNKSITLDDLLIFLKIVKSFRCKEFLLISGSQKKQLLILFLLLII